jgi:hypothetical protein
MKTPCFLRLCLAVIASTFVVQCSSTPKTRIEKNPGMFAKLTPKDRQLVSSGYIREGLSRDGVFLAWGRPTSVTVGTNRGRETENWIYEGQRPIRTMSTSIGFGYGGFGGFGGYGGYGFGGLGGYGGYGGYPMFNSGSSVTYIPYTAGVADFAGGRVISWKSTAR